MRPAVTTTTTYVARSPDACWRVFVDPVQLHAWLPGLRRARVVDTTPEGLPREIVFEFSASLTYSLVYSYDPDAREVRWEPRVGKRDAVGGTARFDAFDAGTRVTYRLQHGDNRTEADRSLDTAAQVVAAFAKWMQRATAS